MGYHIQAGKQVAAIGYCGYLILMKKAAAKTTPDSTDFPHWENPKICATCIHYAGSECRCNLTAFRFPAKHPACPRYIPKKTD